jgi:hypothetical protein
MKDHEWNIGKVKRIGATTLAIGAQLFARGVSVEIYQAKGITRVNDAISINVTTDTSEDLIRIGKNYMGDKFGVFNMHAEFPDGVEKELSEGRGPDRSWNTNTSVDLPVSDK